MTRVTVLRSERLRAFLRACAEWRDGDPLPSIEALTELEREEARKWLLGLKEARDAMDTLQAYADSEPTSPPKQSP